MSFSNTLHQLKYFKFVISIGVFKTGDSHIQVGRSSLRNSFKFAVLIPLVILFMLVVLKGFKKFTLSFGERILQIPVSSLYFV